MGNMGDLAILLVGIVDALFAFFVVAPILLNTASLFGVQKRFAQAMREYHVKPEIECYDAGMVENSLRLAKALIAHNVPVSLHIFPFGPHGVGLGREDSPLAEDWPQLLADFLRTMGF